MYAILGTWRKHAWTGFRPLWRLQYWDQANRVLGQGCSYENSPLAKILIEPVAIFHEIPGMNFVSNLSQHLECRATKLLMFTRWRRSTRKENRLNMCSKQDFIPIPALVVKLAMIIKAVGNLFQTFYLHVDSLIWFRYQVIVHVWIKNCSLSFTEWPTRQTLAGNHIFISRWILPAASA